MLSILIVPFRNNPTHLLNYYPMMDLAIMRDVMLTLAW